MGTGTSCSAEGCHTACGRPPVAKENSRNDPNSEKYGYPGKEGFLEESLDSPFATREQAAGSDHGSKSLEEKKMQSKEEKMPFKDSLEKAVDEKTSQSASFFKGAQALKKGLISGEVQFLLANKEKPGEGKDTEAQNTDPPVEEGGPQALGRQSWIGQDKKSLWQKAGKKALLQKQLGAKIAIENKIGKKLEGWFKDVGLELQRGVAALGKGQLEEVPDFEAPQTELFARIRAACGYTQARYFATMGLQEGLTEPNLALIGGNEAAGRSGSFFFLSPDQQLIAKSCTNEDWRQLLRILPEYTTYIEAAAAREKQKKESETQRMQSVASMQPGAADENDVRGFTETLLPRFLGLYKLRVPGATGDKGKPVPVLIMANVFGGVLSIDRRYDLKGSTHGRKASKKECAKKAPVYKDIDWVSQEHLLGISATDRQMLLKTITSDLAFLAKNMLMDYSLLVGIHDLAKDDERRYEAMNVVTLRDSSRHCYIGIIDVLTPYKMKKRAETFFLGQLVCGRDVSCQHPKVYASRFLRFADEHVLADPPS